MKAWALYKIARGAREAELLFCKPFCKLLSEVKSAASCGCRQVAKPRKLCVFFTRVCFVFQFLGIWHSMRLSIYYKQKVDLLLRSEIATSVSWMCLIFEKEFRKSKQKRYNYDVSEMDIYFENYISTKRIFISKITIQSTIFITKRTKNEAKIN